MLDRGTEPREQSAARRHQFEAGRTGRRGVDRDGLESVDARRIGEDHCGPSADRPAMGRHDQNVRAGLRDVQRQVRRPALASTTSSALTSRALAAISETSVIAPVTDEASGRATTLVTGPIADR